MDNLTFLQILGTLGCAASDKPLTSAQHSVQIPSVEGSSHFGLLTTL